MNGKELEFPSSDRRRIQEDCENLQWIVLNSAGSHCAWLRMEQKLRHENEFPEPAEWSARDFMNALSFGFFNAYEKNLLTLKQLRYLASSPELIEQIADRVFFEGNPEFWKLDLPEQLTLSDFYELVDPIRKQELKDSRDVISFDLPTISSTDSSREYKPIWTKDAPSRLQFDIQIIEDTTLTLKWQDRVWGKLVVLPLRNEFQIRACTGIFLEIEMPEKIHTRLAAATPSEQDKPESRFGISTTSEGITIFF